MSGAGAVAASLPEMLERLKLTAIRDRLDGLLDEAARCDLTLPEALTLLCEAEVAHREERRIQMGLGAVVMPGKLLRPDRVRQPDNAAGHVQPKCRAISQ